MKQEKEGLVLVPRVGIDGPGVVGKWAGFERATVRGSLAAILSIGLAACGGGGSSAPDPALVAAPSSACTPQPVLIQFYGDSTNVSVLPTGEVSSSSPWMVTRDALQKAHGTSVTVESRAVGHMTTANLLQGNDGVNKAWPASVPAGAITLANFGINDSIRWSIDEYKANLRALSPAYFETPNPTDAAVRPHEQTQAYAQAMRDVAAELGRPVIDVNDYVMALPNWRAYLADGIHPSNELYAMIGRDVVLPALQAEVAAMRCQ